MIHAPKLEIEYLSKEGEKVNEEVTFFKQYIVDKLGTIIKLEVLSQVPSQCFDVLMEEITDAEKYTIDMNILREVLAYIRTHDITHKLSVNLNPSTLIHPNFLTEMEEIFSHYHHRDFAQIEFEITENGYFHEDEIRILNENIAKIQALGIKIGIDDYPNLNNNNELLDKIINIDFVKIDKGFLLDYKKGLISGEQLVSMIAKFISDIKLRVGKDVVIVMEGVESQDVLEILYENFGEEIQLFQGYYFHKNEKIEE